MKKAGYSGSAGGGKGKGIKPVTGSTSATKIPNSSHGNKKK